jgi:DNA-binding NarL/FixJ family response regulator
MKIRILVVAEHRLISAALSALLQTMKDLTVIGMAMSAEEATALMGSRPPNLALIDGDLLQQQGDVSQQLARFSPGVPMIVLASESANDALMRTLQSGNASVVLKDATPAELHRAIRTVAEGGTYLSRGVAGHAAGFFADGKTHAREVRTLTSRQRQILQLLAEGCSTKKIADRLGLSPRTVESHRSHIMERLGVRHLAGLIQYAIRTGIAGTS